jgi:Asp-tRNA(Asn)/Glu-tRNA(Gln) amidotransferase A subunit family amidase
LDHPHDPSCTERVDEPVTPTLASGIAGLRMASAGGYFRAEAGVEALHALDTVAAALGATRQIEIPEAARARAAAYVVTTSEGAALHLQRLRTRARDFDPDVRDRLIAGAMVPAAWVTQAQKFRRWYRDAVLRLFEHVDTILAPATPCVAPPIGQKTFMLNGQEVPLRPNIGIYTQPISFIGLPVVAVPVPQPSGMPIAVQIIAAPWREDVALRIAHDLEARGIAQAPRPPQ